MSKRVNIKKLVVKKKDKIKNKISIDENDRFHKIAF